MMEQFVKDLKKELQGEVRHDPISCAAYSVDASIYEVKPLVVVLPASQQDLIRAVQIAKHHAISMIPRGAATGITGGCLGTGMVIDLSKYLNKILEINFTEEWAVCEPGVVQDQLNAILALKGYRLGPDTSTGNRATLGGMLANNAAGAHSLLWGAMVDATLAVELLLSTGELIDCRKLTQEEWRHKQAAETQEGEIYRQLGQIIEADADKISLNFPKLPRKASGYALDQLLIPQPNIAKLMAGSQGTLGIATKVKLQIVKTAKKHGLALFSFTDIREAWQTIPALLATQPSALELIDDQILLTARSSLSLQTKLSWLQGEPQAILVAEYSTEDPADLKQILQHLPQIGDGQIILTDPVKMAEVWAVRKGGLGLLLSRRSYQRAIAFIEDIALPPEKLPAFMPYFQSYLSEKGLKAGIYGHAGAGCLHIRPYINLRHPREVALMQQVMEETAEMVRKQGGMLSGEHGDGLIRSWLTERMFGPDLYRLFCTIKKTFDPLHLMNPGKIVDGPPLTQNLRLDPQTSIISPATFLDFSSQGGFSLAVDLCNGNGECRKKTGVMCPSFQATGDEYDTTRARAQALRQIINGKLPKEAFTSPELAGILDLCIECKGCKRECPSQVDMAKMKAEFLYHYQEKHGYCLRSRLFGNIGNLYRLAAYFPKIFNWISTSAPFLQLLEKAGISSRRSLPPLALERFSSWFNKQPFLERKEKVVLFNDTFNEYLSPEIGQAAVAVLQALDFQVITPPWNCCGRPLFSKGMLKAARKKAETLLRQLLPFAKAGLPIIGLEPSCILTIVDDYPALLSKKEITGLIKQCVTFDRFIASQLIRLPKLIQEPQEVKVHIHCHQKAIEGGTAVMDILHALPGITATEIASGCCGMAGSFGYESEHVEISNAIGELTLFPAIRHSSKETLFLANGTSCRSQIESGTGRKSHHLAEFLDSRINRQPT